MTADDMLGRLCKTMKTEVSTGLTKTGDIDSLQFMLMKCIKDAGFNGYFSYEVSRSRDFLPKSNIPNVPKYATLFLFDTAEVRFHVDCPSDLYKRLIYSLVEDSPNMLINYQRFIRIIDKYQEFAAQSSSGTVDLTPVRDLLFINRYENEYGNISDEVRQKLIELWNRDCNIKLSDARKIITELGL